MSKSAEETLKKGVLIMFRKFIIISTMLFSMGFSAISSYAGICSKRDILLKGLADQYKESRQAIGLISSSRMLEVYTSKKGSWTILVTTTQGVSCIVASGKSYEQLDKKLLVKKIPDA